jgi:Mrr N-terminal domain
MARIVDGRQTPEKNYYIPILQALVDAGGWGTRGDIVSRVEPKMTFVSADLVHRPDGTQKWVRRVGYAIGTLRKNGRIAPAARNGVTITEKEREELSRSL